MLMIYLKNIGQCVGSYNSIVKIGFVLNAPLHQNVLLFFLSQQVKNEFYYYM
ncbi:hypothetical protein Hanom_Chr03g00271941 [Helianthus anomalus]